MALHKTKNRLIHIMLLVSFLLVAPLANHKRAYSQTCKSCNCTTCQPQIEDTHDEIRDHVTDELASHRRWLVESYSINNIIPAMMLMAEQLTAVGIQQVQIIGSFFDAKHQLETQRLFQTLVAQAHKDYQPSEEVCAIGTNMRPLANLERRLKLSQLSLANRMMTRQLLTSGSTGTEGKNSDRRSRLEQFRGVFCNPADNGGHLNLLCGTGGNKTQYNMDVNFTAALENKLTLDFVPIQPSTENPPSVDEQNIFALSANLFANEVLPDIGRRILADGSNTPKSAAFFYLRQRSVAAKRSVAQNSFAALTAMRVAGDEDAAPFSKSVIHELGVDEGEIDGYLGTRPSYFAQMEVLTKKMYQNPQFYADLYDTPANIDRKGAVLQAIALMQDRDIYKTLLRSEAVLATLLETLMQDEHARISRDLRLVKNIDEKIE